jgi:hypothetical protein
VTGQATARFRRLAALAGLVCCLAVAPTAGAIVAYPSHVTIHYGPINKAFTREFSGRVKSPKPGCVSGRLVKVFHKQQGPDSAISPPVETDANGHWAIGSDTAHGRYYAKVKPSLLGNKVCKRTRSEIIKVD